MRADLRAPAAVSETSTSAEKLARWATSNNLMEASQPQTPADMVVLPSGPVSYTECAQKLFSRLAASGTMFLRGGRVVELEKRGKHTALALVEPHKFRSRAECGALYEWKAAAHDQLLLKPHARMSVDVAKAILATREIALLPVIESIVSGPILTVYEGNLRCLPPGFHESRGVLITGGAVHADIPLEKALQTVRFLFEEFDFATSADYSRAVAALVAPALVFGALLRCHCPLFAVEADATQSGKGYLLEVIQKVYAETPSIVMKKRGGVGSFDESLAQAMISARPFIQLDNVRGNIDSEFLEVVLTCPLGATVPARIPNRGEIQVDPASHIFQLTSNGFASTADLANRSCIIRIRKRPEHMFREFAEGGLAEHVAANQPRFLAAVHALVRAWVEKGCLRTADLRGEGRFRMWWQTHDWIVQELCGLTPICDGHKLVQQRASNPALGWLRDLALVVAASDPPTEELNAGQLLDYSAGASLRVPGVCEKGDDQSQRMQLGKILGKVFAEKDSVDLDGIVVRRLERPQPREDGNGYTLVKTYTFVRQ